VQLATLLGGRSHGTYALRPIRYIELLKAPGWRVKVYSITLPHVNLSPILLDAARSKAKQYLTEVGSTETFYGVGFLGVHQGQGLNQVFLDRWMNDNELHHVVWSSPSDRPKALSRVGPEHNSVCVWDLFLQNFEREAWIECVLKQPLSPDYDKYLETVCHDEA
jgi:hypothetical protein